MIEKNSLKQLAMWINHGLLIYSNCEQLRQIWDDEYPDLASELS